MATYKNRNLQTITASEAVNEQWAGRAVEDAASGTPIPVVVDVSAKMEKHADIKQATTSGRHD